MWNLAVKTIGSTCMSNYNFVDNPFLSSFAVQMLFLPILHRPLLVLGRFNKKASLDFLQLGVAMCSMERIRGRPVYWVDEYFV